MRRLLVCVGLVGLLSFPALAQGKPAAAAAAADDGDDEEDDDILAPVRGADEKPASAVPSKERALKVGVLPIVPLGDASKPLADQLTIELTKALNESPTVEFAALALKSSGGAAPIDPAVSAAALKEAEAGLGKSAQLLGKLQFGKAKASYEKTLQLLEKAAPALSGPELLIQAWLGLAEIAARQAQDDETVRCLAFVVGLNPEFEVDQKKYPGLFVTTHRKTRDRLMDGEKVAITVDASAAGAQVVIDGRPIASAPAKALKLYPGMHLVRVLREGLAPWGAVVTVTSGETTLSPGFYDPSRRGPTDDLTQNRFSEASAKVVAEAAAAQGLAGAVVGVLSKAGGTRVATQLVYVDAKGRGAATLPDFKLQGDLLDIGIEVLKARARVEELAGAETPELAAADESEALIEGANAGSAVTLAEVNLRFEVKKSGNLPVASRVGDDDGDGDGDGDERAVVETKSGRRRSLEEKKDRLGSGPSTSTVDEDAPLTEQPWFLPTAITAGVVGVAAIAAGTGVALVAFKVIPDPRPATGAQVSVTLPAATP
jgi:hypothetical protein